jgi:hypothetical protein
MRTLRIPILTVAATLALTAASLAIEPAWSLNSASSVHAYRTSSGIRISASVELPNNCYEAAIHQTSPSLYRIERRIKPKDMGMMCTMMVVMATVQGSFLVHRVPKNVSVETLNKTYSAPVQSASRHSRNC